MQKVYLLDSSVLLHDPTSIFQFDDNEVIIPYAVLEELEGKKRSMDNVGQAAREAIRNLDSLRELGRIAEGVPLLNGGLLRVELNHVSGERLPLLSDMTLADNRILSACVNLTKEDARPVILITKDIAMRVKADALGILTQDYYNDKVNLSTLANEVISYSLSAEEVNRLYQEGSIDLPERLEANICVEGKTDDGIALPLMSSASGKELLFVPTHDLVSWEISPRNHEQSWAVQAIKNPEIRLVSLMGPAGTGKTLLALACGLELTVHKGSYNTVLCARPIVPFGKDIGYLPGEKEHKVRPYMQPFYDNLELLFSSKRYKGQNNNWESMMQSSLDILRKKGLIEIEVLTYIRGRNIPNQFMIIDEAQNLSIHEIKTIITRAGEGTKIILCGDQDQIDHPYLDKESNGLAHIAARLKGQTIYAQVHLTEGQRSQLASQAAELL